jgi:hypothetical protein
MTHSPKAHTLRYNVALQPPLFDPQMAFFLKTPLRVFDLMFLILKKKVVARKKFNDLQNKK